MIDHTSVPVSDFERSQAFYRAALAPIGYEVLMQFPGVAGLGEKGHADLWIGAKPVGGTIHLALRVTSRQQVDAFHAAAVAAGGTDNGPPGLRPQYRPGYYAAFVLDPDGHNLEVVCHEP